MRSRFSAYSLGNSDYIIETTHPNHVDQSIPLEERKAQIKAFSAHTKFKNLEILNSVEGSIVSFVTFRATLYQKDRDCSFTEKSCFEKVGEKLYYLSGTID
jgi:SEC-C motif-containing protein